MATRYGDPNTEPRLRCGALGTQTNAEVALRAAAAQRLKSVVRSCLTPKPPKTRPLRVPGAISLVDLRVRGLGAFLAFAPEVGSREEGLHTRLGHFLVDSSPVIFGRRSSL